MGHQILSKLSFIRRIRQEVHEVYYRDFNHQHIGGHNDKKIETLQVSKRREDLESPFAVTRRGDRGIESQDISIPMGKRLGKSIVKNPV